MNNFTSSSSLAIRLALRSISAPESRWGAQVKHFVKLSHEYAAIFSYKPRYQASRPFLEGKVMCLFRQFANT